MVDTLKKVVELPEVLRDERYIRSLDVALYRVLFKSDLPLNAIKKLKAEGRTSTKIELCKASQNHLSLLREMHDLNIVDSVSIALYDIHTNKHKYFLEDNVNV